MDDPSITMTAEQLRAAYEASAGDEVTIWVRGEDRLVRHPAALSGHTEYSLIDPQGNIGEAEEDELPAIVTKAGRVMTEQDFERLADEAEQGYDR
jgi:hypothetical protein